uniref:DUF4792 domain-containing protein n=1 Tax=Panagrellus redivivus TaxID=6233 RepID=A0A7E4WDM8_PANRE
MGHSVKSDDVESQLPSDVERITPPPQCGIFGSMLIRLVLGVLLLGAGVVAVYYSIEVHSDGNSEEGETDDSAVFFTLRHVQSCPTGGVITREFLKGEDGNGVANHESTKVSSVWIQDDDKSRLYYSIGTQNKSDWEKSFYVLSDHTLLVDNTGCCRHESSYTDFIDYFGLSTLVLMRSEDISIEEEDKYVSVNLFQGEPTPRANP